MGWRGGDLEKKGRQVGDDSISFEGVSGKKPSVTYDYLLHVDSPSKLACICLCNKRRI